MLVVILALPFSTAFDNEAKPTATADEARYVDKSNVDTNYEKPGSIVPFGKKVPTSFWNLVKEDYSGSAEFDYKIYTNYYFSPSANNDIRVYFYVDWNYVDHDSMLRVECY